ncbi:LysR family transcriptional regulator [Reinekea marina]|uniref:LysR family transcriptional regulator n=1 Tax=Reinekea marina TaxID=1310421 RepID=A0ABV7WQK9_9GAMM|nr:LysR family transcriptional regulator [Reinekea marina]MDN3650413.1 LysR family transcriptional regulator [Reinekea marina]
MINPNWLATFCSLVDQRHFTRTAQELHMTQSGVSQHVKKLEQQLGQLLLVRQGKSFTLTTAGERLYAEGKALLLAMKDLEKKIGHDPYDEGIVRIASPGSIGLKLYPQFLALQQQHPKLIIDFRFAPNPEIDALLVADKIDIGFMTQQSSSATLKTELIAHEELRLVTASGIQSVSWQTLLNLGFIDHPDGAHHADQLLAGNFKEYQAIGQIPKAGFSNQINLILEPVAMGLGFTVLPQHAVNSFRDPSLINAHRLNRPVTEPIYLGSHLFKHTPNRVVTIVDEAISALSSME